MSAAAGSTRGEATRAVSEDDWAAARASTKRLGAISGIIGVIAIPLLCVAVVQTAETMLTGLPLYLVAFGVMFVLLGPLVAWMVRYNWREGDKSDEIVSTLTRQLTRTATAADGQAAQRLIQTRRQEFESRLANALDMAEGEPEVVDVIERAFAVTMPNEPVELLLADNSHAHLDRVASTAPAGAERGCSVDSPDDCPAARRAQVQRFDHSEALDACPKLRGRPGGALSALCVPVSIMGRTVGVIHATNEPDAALTDDTITGVETLAKLAGARLGLLRMMTETQLQAATDNLTGLLNRRSFEKRLTAIRSTDPVLSLAMADLDHFKILNDTYGHETGDRALRLFAQVLSGSVRDQDLVSRHGGEEFVVALAGCTAPTARDILESVRTRLDAAITVAGLPSFTVSIGVVETGQDEDLPTALARADAALFQAKHEGRDRVITKNAAGDNLRPDTTANELDTAPSETVQRNNSRADRFPIDSSIGP